MEEGAVSWGGGWWPWGIALSTDMNLRHSWRGVSGEHDEFLFICGAEVAEAWAAVSEMESELEIQGVSSSPVVKIHASLKGAQV